MEPLFTQIRKDWVIIIFIGTLIASWTMFSARLGQAEQKIIKLESTNEQILQIQLDIAVIKEQIINVNKKLE